MKKSEILRELKKMPCGLSRKLQIGENQAGLNFFRNENPRATMDDLKLLKKIQKANKEVKQFLSEII